MHSLKKITLLGLCTVVFALYLLTDVFPYFDGKISIVASGVGPGVIAVRRTHPLVHQMLGHGWNIPDKEGVWTESRLAHVRIPLSLSVSDDVEVTLYGKKELSAAEDNYLRVWSGENLLFERSADYENQAEPICFSYPRAEIKNNEMRFVIESNNIPAVQIPSLKEYPPKVVAYENAGYLLSAIGINSSKTLKPRQAAFCYYLLSVDWEANDAGFWAKSKKARVYIYSDTPPQADFSVAINGEKPFGDTVMENMVTVRAGGKKVAATRYGQESQSISFDYPIEHMRGKSAEVSIESDVVSRGAERRFSVPSSSSFLLHSVEITPRAQ